MLTNLFIKSFKRCGILNSLDVARMTLFGTLMIRLILMAATAAVKHN